MSIGKRFRPVIRFISKPQNAFLLLGTIFGLVFVFLTPPALVGDEPNHFFRAYQISEGHIIGEKRDELSGGWLPKNLLHTNRVLVGDIEMRHDVKFDTKLIWELLYLPLNDEDKVFERFPNTVVYTPFPYAPQVVGIWVGKVFGATPLVMIYLARLCNLLFFLGIAYFVILKTPVHKWVFCLLCLTPTNVFQVASASADVFTYGICFLTIAYVLSYALDDIERLGKREITILFLLCLLSSLSKQAYLFLPLLFLIIPRRKFSSVGKYFLTFGALMTVCFGAVAAWSSAIKPIYLPYRNDQPISPEEQLKFILGAPFEFLKMAVEDYFVKNLWFYFKSFSGQLTWFDLYVPDYLPVFVFALLVIFAVLDHDGRVKIGWSQKIVFLLIFISTAGLISTLLYMTWSPIHGNHIEGIQGRYFIPIAPLFFLLFYNRKIKSGIFEKFAPAVVYPAVIFSLVVTINSVIQRYYI